ncbi:MAG: hypothetical protein RBS39_05925 [Phycisphaerales bacterium]|jgi:hypothetical protein|nr:hypothetical protein [Phycisphaerales bacterium]
MQSLLAMVLTLFQLALAPLGAVSPATWAMLRPVEAMATLRLTPIPESVARSVAARDEVPEWPVTSPAAPVIAHPAPPEVDASSIRSADDLLRALETSGSDLRTLEAQMRHVRTFVLQGDVQTRVGRVVFAQDPAGEGKTVRRRFAVLFEKMQVGSRLEDERKEYVFDGTWLVERLPDEKLFIKRQVVAPGESFDPLRVGEGPFPLPIGQRRDDIVSRFKAELVAGEAGLSEKDAAFGRDCFQLVLTPRGGRDSDAAFQEIRLWYEKAKLLPRMARTVDWEGDETLVQLIDVRTNAAVDDALLDTTTPPAGSGWDVQVRPWRESAEGGA